MQYEKATVQDMRNLLDTGAVSAVSLLAEAKRVIAEKDGAVKAFVEVFDFADEDAKRADAMLKEWAA